MKTKKTPKHSKLHSLKTLRSFSCAIFKVTQQIFIRKTYPIIFKLLCMQETPKARNQSQGMA